MIRAPPNTVRLEESRRQVQEAALGINIPALIAQLVVLAVVVAFIVLAWRAVRALTRTNNDRKL
jgi:hypothetical protein